MARCCSSPDFVERGSGLRYHRGQPRSLRKYAHWVASGIGPHLSPQSHGWGLTSLRGTYNIKNSETVFFTPFAFYTTTGQFTQQPDIFCGSALHGRATSHTSKRARLGKYPHYICHLGCDSRLRSDPFGAEWILRSRRGLEISMRNYCIP
jgi:hypothetical protein